VDGYPVDDPRPLSEGGDAPSPEAAAVVPRLVGLPLERDTADGGARRTPHPLPPRLTPSSRTTGRVTPSFVEFPTMPAARDPHRFGSNFVQPRVEARPSMHHPGPHTRGRRNTRAVARKRQKWSRHEGGRHGKSGSPIINHTNPKPLASPLALTSVIERSGVPHFCDRDHTAARLRHLLGRRCRNNPSRTTTFDLRVREPPSRPSDPRRERGGR
jgi:hypothetical protein